MHETDSPERDRVLETSFGERFEFRVTGDESGGELLRIDSYLDPGVRRPLHSHPRQEERFEVHEGRLGLAVGEEERVLEAGEEDRVTAGTPHTFWNAGEEPVRMRTEHRPALRFEEFLRAMVRLDERGDLDENGMPDSLLVGAGLLAEFQAEMRPADVPAPVQRFVFPLLGRIGVWIGYEIPGYGG